MDLGSLQRDKINIHIGLHQMSVSTNEKQPMTTNVYTRKCFCFILFKQHSLIIKNLLSLFRGNSMPLPSFADNFNSMLDRSLLCQQPSVDHNDGRWKRTITICTVNNLFKWSIWTLYPIGLQISLVEGLADI